MTVPNASNPALTDLGAASAADAAGPDIAGTSLSILSPSSALPINPTPIPESAPVGLDHGVNPKFPHIFAKDVGPAGMGLFTSKSLGPGELVLRDTRPLGCVLDTPLLEQHCAWCLKGQNSVHIEAEEEIVLKKCGGCSVVKFCNQDCQKSAWKSHHKHECKIFKTLYPKVLPNSIRMAVQFLVLRKNGALSDLEWLKLTSLRHHIKNLKKRARNEVGDFDLMAKAVQKYSGTKDDLGLVESLLGRIMINTLTLVNSSFDPLGLALSPQVALINHSCFPNSVISFSGPTLSVRTIIPIPANTQITISYIDNTEPPRTRQHQLASRYFFTCECSLCTAAPHPCTLSLSNPEPPPALSQTLVGSSSNSPTALTTLDNSIEKSILESRSLALTPTAQAGKLRDAIMQIAPFAQSGSYPVHRQPYARLRAELVQSLLSSSQFVEAFHHQLVISVHIDPIHFPQPFHPVRLSHKYVLYKLSLHLLTATVHAHHPENMTNDEAEEEEEEQVLALLAKMPGLLDFRLIAVRLLRDISRWVGKGFGKQSRFAKVIEAEKAAGGFFQVAEEEEKEVTDDRMVDEMWKDLKVLVGVTLGLYDDIKVKRN